MMPTIRNAAEFGSLVRARRQAAGLSQQALADKVGLSRQSIVVLEQGKESFELGAALRCLRALETTLAVATRGDTKDGSKADAPVPKAPRSTLDAHLARFRKGSRS